MEWKKFSALFALQFNSLSVINSHWGYGFQRHTFKYHESRFALTIDKILCAEYISGCRYVFIFIYLDGYMYICRVYCTVHCTHRIVCAAKTKTKAKNIDYMCLLYVRNAQIRCSSAWQIRSDVFSLSESWSCFQQVAE